MSIVKTSAKGQVVIPAEIRRRAGLHSGDKVSVQEQDGVIIITPVAKKVESLKGILKGQPSLIDALMKTREEERRREAEEAA